MVGWKDRKVVNPTGEVFFLIFSKARDVGCWGSAWGNSSNPVICGASTLACHGEQKFRFFKARSFQIKVRSVKHCGSICQQQVSDKSPCLAHQKVAKLWSHLQNRPWLFRPCQSLPLLVILREGECVWSPSCSPSLQFLSESPPISPSW